MDERGMDAAVRPKAEPPPPRGAKRQIVSRGQETRTQSPFPACVRTDQAQSRAGRQIARSPKCGPKGGVWPVISGKRDTVAISGPTPSRTGPGRGRTGGCPAQNPRPERGLPISGQQDSFFGVGVYIASSVTEDQITRAYFIYLPPISLSCCPAFLLIALKPASGAGFANFPCRTARVLNCPACPAVFRPDTGDKGAYQDPHSPPPRPAGRRHPPP